MSRKIVRLTVVHDEIRKGQARAVRQEMFDSVRSASAEFGQNISGYAMVIWNRKGELMTTMSYGHGPYSRATIPAETCRALDRHLAIQCARFPSSMNDEE